MHAPSQVAILEGLRIAVSISTQVKSLSCYQPQCHCSVSTSCYFMEFYPNRTSDRLLLVVEG